MAVSDVQKIRQVSARSFQHNISSFLNYAVEKPVLLTRRGSKNLILLNPETYLINKKRHTKKNKWQKMLKTGFIGMYENRSDREGKSSVEIAKKLREEAWGVR